MTRNDLAGPSYWQSIYQAAADLPLPVDPKSNTWGNYLNRQLHTFFAEVMPSPLGLGMRLLELGCGNSQWLPYFAKCGFDVWGIDYAHAGCAGAREILRRAQMQSTQIICTDLFQPPPSLLEAFDVVLSQGLAEHFQNTLDFVLSCTRFLKPGGTIVTVIPNMRGVVGFLQKHSARPIYDKHVPLNLGQLVRAHEQAGLGLKRASYICFFNFSVVNLGEATTLKNFAYRWGHRFSMVLGAAHEAGLPLKPNRFSSSHIACAFRKPCVDKKPWN
jgi:2-polyprenyl-3-methyl-5-hydroxy-6-metoxy-1,4-benzoquinol methylase